jgi:hypothetical protein
MRDTLICISNELSECLDCVEKHPTLAAYHIGYAQSRIEILIESLKEEEDEPNNL